MPNVGYRKGNKIIIDGDVALILLHGGNITTIDVEDVDRVKGYTWHFDRTKNEASAYLSQKPQRKICLARLILFGEEHNTNEKFVDHKDHNRLNNRKKSNLRPATNQQNNFNTIPRKITSQYKGVYWHKRDKKWVARITTNRKHFHLGYFEKEIEAAKAYDKVAKELHGEFAYLNFGEFNE